MKTSQVLLSSKSLVFFHTLYQTTSAKSLETMKMILALLFFLFLGLSAQIGANPDECKEQSCSPDGPAIRFPFRLKDQPHHCGYPGFEVSCTEKNQTVGVHPHVALSAIRGRGSPFAGFSSFWCQIFSHVLS